jgi:MYXO-CTERM domain-containing protein
MRRALPLLALLVPALSLAQVPAAGTIQVLPSDRNSGNSKYLGTLDCTSATNTIGLAWTIQLATGATFTAGRYKLFATNTQPTGTPAYCDVATGTSVVTKEVTDWPATSTSMPQQSVLTQRILDAVGLVHDATGAQTCNATGLPNVYLCVQYYDANNNRNGLASVTLTAQLEAAPIPTSVSAAPRSNALDVSWTAGSSNGVTIHHYVATATDPDGVSKTGTTGDATTSVTVGGLKNNVAYTVTVHSVSLGGNASAESAAAPGTPLPSDDFWKWYKDQGGAETGGCSTGAAGGLALLGVASLLAFRRRRSR